MMKNSTTARGVAGRGTLEPVRESNLQETRRQNGQRLQERRTATFGRRYVPIGSTLRMIVGMVLPPVKRTCRANASPLVW
jgi:hypothetical protein